MISRPRGRARPPWQEVAAFVIHVGNMAMFVLILITRPWAKGRKRKREKRKENGQKRTKTTEWERIFEEEKERGFSICKRMLSPVALGFHEDPTSLCSEL